MSKSKITSYPEIDHIREDLESLKTNVVELTRHMQENGRSNAEELTKEAQKRLSRLQSTSKRELHKLERRVKAKPSQSMAIAFAAGIVASLLMSRGR